MKGFWQGKLKYVVLAVAAGFLLIGILNGEATAVFGKAATICLECIGIG